MNKKLGRGLSGMFRDKMISLANQNQFCNLDTHLIFTDLFEASNQIFSFNILQTLAKSIQEYGLLMPILVKEESNELSGAKKYQLIAGFKRLKVAKLIGMQSIFAIILNKDFKNEFILSGIENTHRESPGIIQEFEYYNFLINHYNLTIPNIAKILYKDEYYIRDILSINNFTNKIKEAINENCIDISQANIISKYSQEMQIDILEKIKNAKSIKDNISKNNNKEKSSLDLNNSISSAYDILDSEQKHQQYENLELKNDKKELKNEGQNKIINTDFNYYNNYEIKKHNDDIFTKIIADIENIDNENASKNKSEPNSGGDLDLIADMISSSMNVKSSLRQLNDGSFEISIKAENFEELDKILELIIK